MQSVETFPTYFSIFSLFTLFHGQAQMYGNTQQLGRPKHWENLIFLSGETKTKSVRRSYRVLEKSHRGVSWRTSFLYLNQYKSLAHPQESMCTTHLTHIIKGLKSEMLYITQVSSSSFELLRWKADSRNTANTLKTELSSELPAEGRLTCMLHVPIIC